MFCKPESQISFGDKEIFYFGVREASSSDYFYEEDALTKYSCFEIWIQGKCITRSNLADFVIWDVAPFLEWFEENSFKFFSEDQFPNNNSFPEWLEDFKPEDDEVDQNQQEWLLSRCFQSAYPGAEFPYLFLYTVGDNMEFLLDNPKSSKYRKDITFEVQKLHAKIPFAYACEVLSNVYTTLMMGLCRKIMSTLDLSREDIQSQIDNDIFSKKERDMLIQFLLASEN